MSDEENDDFPLSLKPTEEEKPEREEWIYTFADMITLILCFFIILFASQNTNTEILKAISLSLRGGPPASPYVFSGGPSVLDQLETKIKSIDNLEDVSVTVDDRGIVVQLGEAVRFREGSAILSSDAINVISKFALLIKVIPNSIVVEGHTNISFQSNNFYRSPWELSSVRAAQVASKLEEYGINSNRMEVVGFGSTRPRTVSNDSKLADYNNRVEILIRPDDGPGF